MAPLTSHPKDGNYILFIEKIDEISEKDSFLAKSNEKACAELVELYKKSKDLTCYDLPDEIKGKYPEITADDIRIIAPDANYVHTLSNPDFGMLALVRFHVGYENPAIFKLSFNQRNLGLEQLCIEMRDLLCRDIFYVTPEYFMQKREEILRWFRKDYEPKIVENGVVYPYSSWLLKQSCNPSTEELKFKIISGYYYNYNNKE